MRKSKNRAWDQDSADLGWKLGEAALFFIEMPTWDPQKNMEAENLHFPPPLPLGRPSSMAFSNSSVAKAYDYIILVEIHL